MSVTRPNCNLQEVIEVRMAHVNKRNPPVANSHAAALRDQYKVLAKNQSLRIFQGLFHNPCSSVLFFNECNKNVRMEGIDFVDGGKR